jgi:hypothetical protein
MVTGITGLRATGSKNVVVTIMSRVIGNKLASGGISHQSTLRNIVTKHTGLKIATKKNGVRMSTRAGHRDTVTKNGAIDQVQGPSLAMCMIVWSIS